MSGGIEFWFDFSSSYSYLSVMRIADACAARGLALRWRPFLLGAVFARQGWRTSPILAHPDKEAYMWRDIARQCAHHGLPWTRPGVFPRRALLPLRIACLGADEPWIEAFCRQVMTRNFVHDREIDDAAAMAEILAGLDLPGADILAAAEAEEGKARLRRQTEEAQARGVFGAPTFFAGTEMFWGNDRLDEAVAWAAGTTASGGV